MTGGAQSEEVDGGGGKESGQEWQHLMTLQLVGVGHVDISYWERDTVTDI